MAYSRPYDFIQLKAFFLALQQSRFNLSLISSAVVLDGMRTPIDKVHCLTLLRSFPDLQGEKFKDDNSLIKYLSQPGNIQRILGQLPIDQQIELTKALVENPAAVGVTGEQPSDEATSAEQGAPVQPPVGTATGATGMPGLPSVPSISPARWRTYKTPPSPTEAKTPQPELAVANKSGTVVGEHTIPPSASQRFNFRSFKTPNFVKNFSSATQIFTKKNLGRIGRGLGDMVKGAGRGIGSPMLNGVYGGLGKVWNGGLRNFPNIPRPRLGGLGSTKLKGFGTGKKVALAFSIFGLFFGFSLIAAISQSPTTSEASPQNNSLLDYTIPFRDASVTVSNPEEIKKQIVARWPNAKLENWDTIVQQSIQHNWNSAFVLALWIEETGAQGEVNYTDPLGCDPTHPTTDINVSLQCLFNNFGSYTNEQFAQFMLRYSEGLTTATAFIKNPNFPSRMKDEYSKLVPSGPGALTEISSALTELSACPVSGTISTPYGYNIYGYVSDAANEDCPTDLKLCHSGVDIAAEEGTPIKSVIDGTVIISAYDDFKGNYIIITDSSSKISITYAHLKNPSTLNKDDLVHKGDVVGLVGHTGKGVTGNHVHYRIRQGLNLLNPLKYLHLSDPDPILPTTSDNLLDNNYQEKPPQMANHNKDNWGQCNQ